MQSPLTVKRVMSQTLFNHIAVIGLGQMGASLLKAFRAYAVTNTLSGYDLDAEQAELLVKQGTLPAVTNSIADAVKGADLVVLCVPISAYGAVSAEVTKHANDDVIITDIGSVKRAAVDAVSPHLRASQVFVSAHPIAGSEKSGAEHATADLFQGRLFLVTLEGEEPTEASSKVITLWQRIRADAQYLPTDLHDQIYGLMSHIPQLLSYVAAHVLRPRHVPPVEDALKRHLRIAKSDPLMWRDVLLHNRQNMLEVIEFITHILGHMRHELLAGASAAEQEKSGEPVNAGAALPYILASSLISTVTLYETRLEIPLQPFAAGGFTDFTHAASVDPDPVMQAISAHAADAAQWLEEVEIYLNAVNDSLKAEDGNALLVQLTSMQQSGQMLLQ